MTIELRDMPSWPAALDMREAYAYSRLSESEMRRAIRKGEIVFLTKGRGGRKVCLRSDLDALLKRIWSDGKGVALDDWEDMDFGRDPDDAEPLQRGRRLRR